LVCRRRSGRVTKWRAAWDRTARFSVLLLLTHALAAVAGNTATAASGQPSTARDIGKHLGVATCASTICHGSVRSLDARTVQQNEYVTWSNFDPHSRAYKILFDPKSQRIAQRLGLKNAHQSLECLGCHSDAVGTARQGERFQVSDGIGCEACHGGSEKWLATHDDAPGVTHAANLANGMRKLESPVVRAEVCLDCHLGSGTRFASHQMMAAGHPRLAFELDTYTELWRTSGGREHYKVDPDYAARKGRHDPVVVWLTGLSAASRRTSDMINWHATKPNVALPDFSLYNCYSCHRTMQLSVWSSGGQYDGLPAGTLRLQDGHIKALLSVLDALNSRQASLLRESLSAMHASVGGDKAALRQATERMSGQLAGIENTVSKGNWSKGELKGVLNAMTGAARRGAFADYAAAEQAAMAMVLLVSEMDPGNVRSPEVDALFKALEDDKQFDGSRFQRALSTLRETRPAGRR